MPTEQISIRLETDLLEALNALAESESRSRANLIAVLLREALTARGAKAKPKK